MFTQARIKLTGWYLLIIMTISLLFSLLIFRVQIGEAQRILQRQRVVIESNGIILPTNRVRTIDPQLLEEVQDHLLRNLFLINIVILILAGGSGYLLSGLTLKPIEDMVEEQKRFIGDASHELRTPLATLKTELEVGLRKKGITKEAKEILQSNLEEVDKMSYLTDKLLHLSSFEGNELIIIPLSLKEVLVEAISKVTKLAKNKQIIINSDLTEVSTHANLNSLLEAFGTILDNAIKYSPKESQVNVRLVKAGNKAVITIEDFGIGISEKELPFIFKRFYRADTARTKEKVAGFGLGLAIAKTVIENHHGTITVKSTPDQGTTFTITLPAY